MNKQEFIAELKKKLFCLPYQDIEKSVEYYNEIIDDSVEDGMSEEDAVASLGDIDEIVSQILMETPITTLVKEKVKQGRTLQAWEIVLLILGSPIWLSLGIAIFSVAFSLYIAVWAIVFSLFVVVLALFVTALALLIASVGFLFTKAFLQSALCLGAAFVIAGVTILLFLGSWYTAKGIAILTKMIFKSIKTSFTKKGEN